MIKAIIFDFFGVLVTEGFKQFLDAYFANDPQKRKEAINEVVKFDSGMEGTNRHLLIDNLAKIAGISSEKTLEYFNSNKPNKMLLGYIRKSLKPKYKISVLSNAGDDFISELLSDEDQKLFDDIVLSYRFLTAKPAPDIYQLALKRLSVTSEEAVFIDDSPSHCIGAQAMGLQTVLYENFPKMKKDLEKILSSASNH
jgi:HAD superfamily hydrolase (TIGR01509 family)